VAPGGIRGRKLAGGFACPLRPPIAGRRHRRRSFRRDGLCGDVGGTHLGFARRRPDVPQPAGAERQRTRGADLGG
jgi:hypothetical protein